MTTHEPIDLPDGMVLPAESQLLRLVVMEHLARYGVLGLMNHLTFGIGQQDDFIDFTEGWKDG